MKTKISSYILAPIFVSSFLVNYLYAQDVSVGQKNRELLNISTQKNNKDNKSKPNDDFLTAFNDELLTNQLQELKKISHGLDKVFDKAFNELKNNQHIINFLNNKKIANKYDIKITDEKDKYIAILDLPEINKNTVSAKIENQSLVITANIQEKFEITNEQGKQIKQYASSFMKSLLLPEAVQPESLKMDFNNNVVKITVKKK